MEKEINKDDKEATPVEGIEVVLPPAEPNRPKETTESVNMDSLMEFLKKMDEKIDDSSKELKEDFKGELNKKNGRN